MRAFLPKSFFTSSTLMYMLTLGLLLLLTPEGLLGLARQPAPSSSRRKKKPPSLHSTECGQPRDSGGVPEPWINPNIAVSGRLASQLFSVFPSRQFLSHPYLKLIPRGDITSYFTPQRHFFFLFFLALTPFFPPLACFFCVCLFLLADTG